MGAPQASVARPRRRRAIVGIAWILASCAALSGVSACSRALGTGVDAWQLSFVRAAVGLVALLPWLASAGLAGIATRHPMRHATRAVFLTAAMYCGFHGFTHLPLADATGLYFARPLFIVVLSALWLRHAIGVQRWLAVAGGFAGMLLVIRPGAGGLQAGAWVPAVGALLIAVALLQVKRMQGTESDLAIVFYSNAFGAVLALPLAWWYWQPVDGRQSLLLGAAGLLGVISQSCMVKAYRAAEPSTLAPVEYLQIPFTVALAFALFGELPGTASIAGIALIVAAGLHAGRLASRSAAGH